MAFGKLTILSEGGEVEEVELTKPTTSVGRQPGNDIVLNTSAISRYHAQFDAAEGQVFVVDLDTVNGTFVNDRQIEPNARVPLAEGDIVMMGDVRLIFHPHRMQIRSIDVEASLSPTSTVFEDPRVPIRLLLDDPRQPVAPGSHSQLALIVHNRSDSEQIFSVELSGMEADWAKANRREVHLEPNEQTEVMISIRPPRSSSTRPGPYPLTVRVTVKDDPSHAIEAIREIEIAGYSGLAMAIQESHQSGDYHLAVQNQGNTPTDLQLSGYQSERLLRFQFTPARLHLEPGETAQVGLRVRMAGSGPFGQTRRIEFAVVAHSMDKASYQAPLPAAYTATPSWPAWLAGLTVPLVLAGGLLIVALVAGAYFLGFIKLPFGAGTTPEPTTGQAVTATSLPPTVTPPATAFPTPVVGIVTFYAQPSEVVFGTQVGVVTFRWQVTEPKNVQGYALHEKDTGETLPLIPENWSASLLAVDVGELVEKFGWDEHTYLLMVAGTDGQERTEPTSVTITPVTCTMALGAAIYPQPVSEGTPVPTPLPHDVAVGGRTADGSWLQVWDIPTHHLLGYAPITQVTCPPERPIEQFVVVEVTPTPVITTTP